MENNPFVVRVNALEACRTATRQLVHCVGPWVPDEEVHVRQQIRRIETRYAGRVGDSGMGCRWVIVKHAIDRRTFYFASRTGIDYVFRSSSVDVLSQLIDQQFNRSLRIA